MTRYRLQPPRRSAFTLIELLVVIAIIAILVSLSLAGLSAARDAGLRTLALSEITNLVDSMEVAHKEYRDIKFLPSKLILYNDITVYKTLAGVPVADVPTVKRTGEVLTYMFGRRLLTNGTTVSWDGTATTTNRVVLTGPECLVFYLGGMPSTTGGNKCNGFSTNPTNPTAPGGERIGPFYQFKSNRLALGPSGIFFMYNDPYGNTPYVYFGLTGAKNSYDPADTYSGMAPYIEPNGTYLLPDRYQIISAGKDGVFGPGGTWNPQSGSEAAGTRDNIANFSRALLGGPRS